MEESVHIAPASAPATKRKNTDSDEYEPKRRTFKCRMNQPQRDLPIECQTYVDEATKFLVNCSGLSVMSRTVEVVSHSWFRLVFFQLPRLRINVMLQLTKTNIHPKRFAIDVFKNRILLETWKCAGSSAAMSAVRQKQTRTRTRTRTRTKQYAKIDQFPHVSSQDLRHINEVLNTMCSNYLFLKSFDINIVLQNSFIIVKAKFRDIIEMEDLVKTMDDWNIIVYDIVLDFPNNSIDFYLKTSDAESSHLAFERMN